MAVTREQSDQGQEHCGESCDPALAVKSKQSRSQPEPRSQAGRHKRPAAEGFDSNAKPAGCPDSSKASTRLCQHNEACVLNHVDSICSAPGQGATGLACPRLHLQLDGWSTVELLRHIETDSL